MSMKSMLGTMAVAALLVGSMWGPAGAAEPKACLKSCAAPQIRLAQDRTAQCSATKDRCRARCPKEGSPGWEHCVTVCGEAFEHCLGG
jgi:hypothetical protein